MGGRGGGDTGCHCGEDCGEGMYYVRTTVKCFINPGAQSKIK